MATDVRALLNQLRYLAGDRCDYCRIPALGGSPAFPIDHIIAQQHGGETIIANLALSCVHCNKHKGPNIASIDPMTGQLVALFHPREQSWNRHFIWNGAILEGRTRSARATIGVLAMNDPDFAAFRSELMEDGESWLE